MKIILTGAQGTGKTTIKNMLNIPGYIMGTEVARTLSAEEGVKINEEGNEESQWKIFNKYVEMFSENENIISDRGLTDVVAYSEYLATCGKMSWEGYNKMRTQMFDFYFDHRDEIINIHFPVEFELQNDGTRSMDKEFRDYIAERIKVNVCDIMMYAGIDSFELTGSVKERMEEMDRILKLKGVCKE